MTYQERLRVLREDCDLSQEKVAKLLYVSRIMYSKYERGECHLPIEHLVTLCKFYHVSADDVLGLSGRRMPLPDTEKDGQ
ncbi:MAG TPA: helix-turn-helix transcriptional regulator [Candidatus Aphodoplasma excrementigallinarum]|uniref:Helix-turn-helix transcriptional regulator n=1 Tax=Candidatus Aphodoplasma excrementigallinarum TaxID=2840673 RepID=A0A9D1NHF1_9FIRM|nr:helix-turn-helix transcriptional regulator [Candidatus Aphodoplasma excrementigallinarum]